MTIANDGNCKGCGNPLVREKWNTSTDIIICDNYECRFFRIPISNMTLRGSSAANSQQELDKPEWLGGPYGQTKNSSSHLSDSSIISIRVQRLRRLIHTEDEETEIS